MHACKNSMLLLQDISDVGDLWLKNTFYSFLIRNYNTHVNIDRFRAFIYFPELYL